MLKNYLTIAIRNLMRNKLYAFINIFGLALGIACCLLMVLYIKYEWSHDRFHKNKDRIFRLITNEIRPNGDVAQVAIFAPEIPQALIDEIPGIAQATGFIRSSGRITFGERTFDSSIGLVHSDFLDLFTFPLIAGDPTIALNRPDGIVITESIAHTLFDQITPGYGNVLGQSLVFPNQKLIFVITGVMAPVPQVSSLSFEALISARHANKFGQSNMGRACMSVYVKLAQGQGPQTMEVALRSFMPESLGAYVSTRKKWNNLRDSEDAFSLALQPLTDVYWNESVHSHYEAKGNLTGTVILSGIAVLVLFIACSNFTTLSVAQSSNRILEVGMRKVLGANRRQVMQQFWSEALLLSFISLWFGLALAELLLPMFNGLIQRELRIAYWSDKSLLLILVMITTVTGILSGSYPSLVLARLQPISAMKGQYRIGRRNRLVPGLVVLQYIASIAMMACTGVMLQQQAYIRRKNLGYDQEHIVVVRTEGHEHANRYKAALLQEPRILGVTLSDRAFTTGSSTTGYNLPNGTTLSVRLLRVDPDYLSTLRIELVAGRNFSEDHPTDRSQAVIINETLARLLNQDDFLGRPLDGFDWETLRNPTIIGVVRDFHIDGLQKKVQPLVMQMHRFMYWPSLLIRVHPEDGIGSVERLQEIWKNAVSPDVPIRLSFLDESLDRQYRNEQRWQQILSYASLFGIAISCLGLLGLASLAVAQRTKEIGIRKVLGASASGIILLLSRDFVKLVLIANLIAWPVAYYAMNRWLENFAYRIDLSWEVFVLSGGLALVIALLTVSGQAWKAARANPVDALRNE